MEWITANGDVLVQMVLSVVGFFSLIATLTKNESDNKVADVLLKIINALAGNFGRSKNATQEELDNR